MEPLTIQNYRLQKNKKRILASSDVETGKKGCEVLRGKLKSLTLVILSLLVYSNSNWEITEGKIKEYTKMFLLLYENINK